MQQRAWTKLRLLNHSIGTGEQCRRDIEAERPSSIEMNPHHSRFWNGERPTKLGRSFAWQIFQELRTTPKPSAAKER